MDYSFSSFATGIILGLFFFAVVFRTAQEASQSDGSFFNWIDRVEGWIIYPIIHFGHVFFSTAAICCFMFSDITLDAEHTPILIHNMYITAMAFGIINLLCLIVVSLNRSDNSPSLINIVFLFILQLIGLAISPIIGLLWLGWYAIRFLIEMV
jgi:hypothetical protein